MKRMLLTETLRGVLATLVFTALCGGLYPAIVWAIGQTRFPRQAMGSPVHDASGKVAGSSLLAQHFEGPAHFHARPSAAGVDGYDVKASGGSNLGPTSRKLADTLMQRLAAYRRENGLADGEVVPADAVTASGSGLDPDISPANAALQARRVAAARSMPVADLEQVVRAHTRSPDFGLLGEPRVNVVTLNLALDDRGSLPP